MTAQRGYVVRVPILLSPGFRWGRFARTGVRLSAYAMRVHEDGQSVLIKVRGVRSELEGTLIVARIREAVMRLGLRYGFGARIRDQLGHVTYAPRPIPRTNPNAFLHGAEGIADGNAPTVVRASKRIVYMTLPGGTAWSSLPVRKANRLWRSAFARSQGRAPAGKIALALDLFTASCFEYSRQAQFLTLMSALEALKTWHPLPIHLRRRVQSFQSAIRQLPTRSGLDARRIQSLLSNLQHLENESIGSAIRSLVQEHLGGRAATTMPTLYGIRSRFLHDGVDSGMAKHVHELRSITGRLLLKLLP